MRACFWHQGQAHNIQAFGGQNLVFQGGLIRADADFFPLLEGPQGGGIAKQLGGAGVDFPLLLHDWAAGRALRPVTGYRSGVRMRWLGGDLRLLRETLATQGRPDVSTRLTP